MRGDNFDVKGFPCLHPTGRFGLHYERDIKVPDQMYFVQRLLNRDQRFAKNIPYLFMAHQKVEREMLEKQINVSGLRGSLGTNSEVTQLHDSFSVFQKIAGSPKYWQVARSELIAKVQQLGPFHAFFTLSCAEMRWIEVYISVLRDLGITGLEITHGKDGNWNGLDAEVLVIDDTLDKALPILDYLKEKKLCKNKTLMNYIVLITRIFDDRVKSFLKNIVMKSGENEPNFRYYSYRIEFQARGLPHVHGVLWLDIEWLIDWLEKQWREMKNNDNKLSKSNWWENKENEYKAGKVGFNLDEEIDRKMVAKLIDEMISCEIPSEEEDKELNEFVPLLQKHRHTDTCFKKSKINCRFGFPKLPSEETLVAIPIDEKFPEMSKERKKKKLEKYTSILEKAKIILSDKNLDPKMTFEKFYEQLETTKEKYMEAVSTTKQGKVIVLERRIAEVWINNYNPLWLKCWNANMDLQFAIDEYAIITYVVSYVGKDETGMTKFLKDVLKNTKGLPIESQMKALKTAWLDHRQIGSSETVYRILPGLHLKDSNITCIFVASGFPENRASFFKKVSEEDSKFEKNDEESDDEDVEPHAKKIKLANRDGTYQQKTTVHDRYAMRPKVLEEMCLAQFAVSYKPTSKVPEKTVFNSDHSSEESSNMKVYSSEEVQVELPKYIDLKIYGFGYMRAREFEAVLRIHNSSKKKEHHEQFYAELLLYYPWRDEVNCLKRNDADECEKLYHTNFDKIIQRNKEKLCPYQSVAELSTDVEELEKMIKEKPSHIYDMIDSQMVQDDEDDDFEGIQDDVEFTARNPDGLVEEPKKYSNTFESKFKHLVVPDDYDLLEMTRKLVPEQLQGLSKVIKYCKDVKRNSKNINHAVNPLRLIIQGGSGSGKSSVLRCSSLHAEKILRKAGDKIDKPHVLICAPTGCAAKNVDGATLHSVFDFNFGNEHVPLKDKKLAIARDLLSELKLIIIDEISMVKADMLYQLHMRLCEIFQEDEVFAGIGMVFVGDLLQLKPIKGVYPFDEPSNSHFSAYHDVNPLWKLFEVIDLRENHRQGDAKEWVEELNNIRKGNVTEKAEQMLRDRLIKPPDDKKGNKASRLSRKRKFKKKQVFEDKGEIEDLTTTHLFYTNDEVNKHNAKMLNTLETSVVEIASHEPGKARSRVKHGCIDSTSFEKDLKIKVKARVMLIFNINVLDGLVNGSLGNVVGIETKMDGSVEFIIVAFDDQNSGIIQRQKYPSLSAKYREQNGTPIKRWKLEYDRTSKNGKKHSAKSWVEQFPMRLAWAITVHKIQGQTIPKGSKLVVHWHQKLQKGMAYVM